MKKVLVIGEILVEIMANEKDQSFLDAGDFSGPYVSGAPAIFIDQVAKFKVPCSILAAVGDDDFGKMCLKKLKEDGVDITNIKITADVSTGIAFVRYNSDGSRNFIFHLKNAACGTLRSEDLDTMSWNDIAVFHVMGSSIFNKEMFSIHHKAIKMIPDECLVSFDPNIRPEILKSDPKLKELILDLFSKTKILFVTEDELEFLTQKTSLKQSLDSCFTKGIHTVIVKRGKAGASVYTDSQCIDAQPISVEEVDPTGAGDTFAGAFIAGVIHQWSLETCLRRANYAGASAVTKRGPMEGTVLFDNVIHK
ncbi:sugar kinase [Oceanispirochaeta crateris]|uniref:Sugar kinase n=1 Tax=Oceanispirochaeta crateris TaxID=2518645 RepID=A0A5C1QRH1_9SPIO|nr:sugar kinase [Oceanispirochaeta crateris]QEN06450.1 sugar kinase [Oceanispirochaeta crateris]QEN09809.1 sugar kinase [Oceanispirochaeta crateris]